MLLPFNIPAKHKKRCIVLFTGSSIVPQVVSLPEYYLFYSSCYQCGQMNYLLEKVPINIIMNTKAPLPGAVYYIQNN